MVKFTRANNQQIELNEALRQKTEKLPGIKGYYTNLDQAKADDRTIIDRYHERYRIEQAFSISKNDLRTRPIFHYKEEPVRRHILICFMSLVLAKHIELKTPSENSSQNVKGVRGKNVEPHNHQRDQIQRTNHTENGRISFEINRTALKDTSQYYLS